MTVEIWTAQYRYSGPDRLDITAGGGTAFAPSWGLVREYKGGYISEKEYEKKYRRAMARSFRERKKEWAEVLQRDRVVLVCFCPHGAFCHRVLLAQILERRGGHYCGEITFQKVNKADSALKLF